MKKLICVLSLIASAFGQGGVTSNAALKVTGGPAAGATIRVCTSTATGTPCSPLATIYSNNTLSTTKTNPFTADTNGNYSYFAAPGLYKEQQTFGTSTHTSIIQVATPVDYQKLDIRSYGGVGDGATDNTSALNAAASAACTRGSGTIVFPFDSGGGKYIFNSKPSNFGCALTIQCNHEVGASFTRGAILAPNYVESTSTNGFMTWDGSSGYGSGGGVEGCLFYRTTGKTGGAAIKLTGTDTTHRAGNILIDHVRVSGDANWDLGIYVDGAAITTAGSQGVRSVYIRDTNVFNTGSARSSIYLQNCVHCYISGFLGDVGAGSANAGITVTGAGAGTSASTDVTITGSEMVDLTSDFATEVVFDGILRGNLSVTANTTTGRFSGVVGGSVTNNSTSTGVSFQNQLVVRGAITSGSTISASGAIQSTSAPLISGSTPSDCSTVGFVCASATTTVGADLRGSDGTFGFKRNGNNWFMSWAADSTFAAVLNVDSTGLVTANGGVKAGASGSTIADSRELVQNAHSCGTTTTCANTANGSNRIVFGNVALSSGTPSTAVVTGITAFTSTTSYVCSATNKTTAADPVKVVNTSTSSITITGPNTVTDSIDYICIGN